MAHVSLQAQTSTNSFFNVAYAAVADIFAAMKASRVEKETFKQLNALSDHELQDLGLVREDIARIAFKGARKG